LTKYEKTSGTSPNPFPFIYGFFPKGQNSQHVHDVKPMLQGLGTSHSICKQGDNIENCQ
jgi:hypothetical protein